MAEDQNQSRVLIVDDIEENLKVLTATLTENGFYPLQARGGQRALEIARKALPDLILLDIKMPGMDGFQTIEALKAQEETRDIPVIFISALNDIEDKVKGFQAGAVDYVSKPFREEEVVARVSTHLKLRQALRAVEKERAQSETLLRNVLPGPVADQLKERGCYEARLYPDVSILFTDFVNFTEKSASLKPTVLIEELNTLFTAFDDILERNGCERIKTIGDAYLGVAGMHEGEEGIEGACDEAHPIRLTRAALEIRDYLLERNRKQEQQWLVRIGIHSGEVIGGIVGTRKYLFDIFGDSVNIASRMESLGEAMKVNVSGDHWQKISHCFQGSPRPASSVKGKGEMDLWFVEGFN